MSTLPATIDHTQRAIAVASAEIDPKILEMVVAKGDLSGLTPAQKVSWYRARCDAAGLDPRTQPFMYLSLQGKLTLYATKTASDQLAGMHRISVEIKSREFDGDTGLAVVHCRATFPDGHFVEDCGALILGGLKGEALANATMKVVTKAKRRTILSACGLGMLDETEVDSIPGARREEFEPSDAHHAKHLENNTGHGSGAYAAPQTVEAYREWCKAFCDQKNGLWTEKWTDKAGELDDRIMGWKNGELINSWQLSGHLVKWARGEGLIQAPENHKPAQADKLAAVVWKNEPLKTGEEATLYVRAQWKEIWAKLHMTKVERPEPEDESQEDFRNVVGALTPEERAYADRPMDVDDVLDDAFPPGRE